MLNKIFRFIFRFVAGFILLSILSVVLFRYVPVPFTPLMLIRCAQQSAAGKSVHMYKSWKPISEISPNLQLAEVASEDQNYLIHMGFDVKAIEADIKYNQTHKVKRGASTISQQTAKNVFLWPSRSFIRKGFEVYFTFLIELIWSKERIMEVYLNVIEMGDGVYGAEAAAQYYFKKPASDLTPYQSACIASIVPDPLKWKISNPPAFVLARQHWILQQMNNIGSINYNEK